MARSQVQVLSCKFISPTVKYFHLQDLNIQRERQFQPFKAGQWLDVFIPDTDAVGGYSISSPPSLFQKSGRFDLAIKRSDTHHPATEWMINQCQEKTTFEYSFGGTVFYDPYSISTPRPLLLIAGGVGINPILSILQAALENPATLSVILIYSVKSLHELIYKKQIEELSKLHTNLHIRFLVTRSSNELTNNVTESTHASITYRFQRLTKDDINDAMNIIGTTELTCYLCGPDTMMTESQTLINSMGVENKSILFERWW